jgi:hypothetical protein
VRNFPEGRFPWDLAGANAITNGRIVRRENGRGAFSIVVRSAGADQRIDVPAKAPVVVLRPGSRAALVSPHDAFIFATPSTDGISDVVSSIIVADGDLVLPF